MCTYTTMCAVQKRAGMKTIPYLLPNCLPKVAHHSPAGHDRRATTIKPLDLLGRLHGVLLVGVRRANLELALLDLLLELVEPAALATRPPGRGARVKDVVHLLEGEALCLGRHQQHVDEGGGVEGAEDVVHVVADVP